MNNAAIKMTANTNCPNCHAFNVGIRCNCSKTTKRGLTPDDIQLDIKTKKIKLS